MNFKTQLKKLLLTFILDITVVWTQETTQNSSVTSSTPSPNFIPLTAGCGGVIVGDRGNITSPNYPRSYSINLDCMWTVEVPEGQKIQITIHDFLLENHPNCAYDLLELRDGTSNLTLIGRYCGSEIPKKIKSTTNKIWVYFKTDLSVNFRGFNISWQSVRKVSEPQQPSRVPVTTSRPFVTTSVRSNSIRTSSRNMSDTNSQESNFTTERSSTQQRTATDKADSMIKHCGGEIFGQGGIIVSPNYPNDYPSNISCLWKLRVPEGQIVKLTVNDFVIQFDEPCGHDALEVGSGIYNSSLIGRFCGKMANIPKEIVSAENRLWIHFQADEFNSFRGFNLSWQSIEKINGCGGKVSGERGIINSPNYPSDYSPYQDCTWQITVLEHQQILLLVSDFSIGQDSLLIGEGAINSTLIGRYSGAIIPREIWSTTNQMWLRLKTSGAESHKGFRVYWQSVSFDAPEASPMTPLGNQLSTESSMTSMESKSTPKSVAPLSSQSSPAIKSFTKLATTSTQRPIVSSTPISNDCPNFCNFEDNSICGWRSPKVSRFHMEKWTSEREMPKQNNGQYYLINRGYEGVLYTALPCSSGSLTFSFFVNITTSNSLALQILRNDDIVLFRYDGVAMCHWQTITVNLGESEPNATAERILFVSYLGRSGGVVALDNICIECNGLQ